MRSLLAALPLLGICVWSTGCAGEKGEKGDRGFRGPEGQPGELNFTEIRRLIKEEVRRQLDAKKGAETEKGKGRVGARQPSEEKGAHRLNNSKTSKMVSVAVCVLDSRNGSNAHGSVEFVQSGHTVMMTGDIPGLTPGKHGFHIHEFGDISARDAMSAGGHYDRYHTRRHGRPHDAIRHAGDLGNATADESGRAVIVMTDDLISLTGVTSIIGRALIVHANADDFSQPVGNAGRRVAAGAIGQAKQRLLTLPIPPR